jgi:hypothetical protein
MTETHPYTNTIRTGEALEETLEKGVVRDRDDLLNLIQAIGYNNVENFFDDNPGAITVLAEFIATYSRTYCSDEHECQDDIADWINSQNA